MVAVVIEDAIVWAPEIPALKFEAALVILHYLCLPSALLAG